MKEYYIKSKVHIPYFDQSDNLAETIANSSARRGLSKGRFIWIKIRNILLYRMAFMCPLNKWRIKMHRRRGITIGENVFIGQHCVLDNAYPEYIYIEDNVSLAGNNIVLAHSNPYEHFSPIIESEVSPVVIKEGAWIGAGAIVLKGVTIGQKSIISAGSVADKSIPPFSLAKGNPIKVISDFSSLIN